MSRATADRRERLLRHAAYLDRQARGGLAADVRAVVEALAEIGKCGSFVAPMTCVAAGRTKGARYGADAWCDGCVAREALTGPGVP